MSAPANRLPRRNRPVTAEDLPDWLVAACPNIVAELNIIIADVWAGDGPPGRGWDGWTSKEFTLEEALAWPVEGRA